MNTGGVVSLSLMTPEMALKSLIIGVGMLVTQGGVASLSLMTMGVVDIDVLPETIIDDTYDELQASSNSPQQASSYQ